MGNNNLLMENMHIGHDCEIGNNCIIGNTTKFAGEVVVDDCAIISAPTTAYIRTCEEGYGFFRFDTAFLDKAYNKSAKGAK